MHELSVAAAILATAEKHADGRPVSVVAMRVGALRQVVVRSLEFYWEIVSRDTVCEGARLAVTELETGLRCESCGEQWSPQVPAFRCPRCAAASVTVISGEQLEVEFIELEGAVHA